MASWEQTISKHLRVLHLESIRSKILVFALLATLIPSLATGWMSYTQNKRALTEKIAQELRTVGSQAARELELWLKERLYDLRVFASSYEVSENLDHSERRQALPRLRNYLNSVRDRLTDYEELLVLDGEGRIVATSADRAGTVRLPPDWLAGVRRSDAAIGETYWDADAGKPVMMIAVPIRAGDRFLGALAGRLNLGALAAVLRRFTPTTSGQVYLMTPEARVLVGSASGTPDPLRAKLAAGAAHDLFARNTGVVEYTSFDGRAVVGTLEPVPQLRWAVVAEIPSAAAYEQAVRLRNATALIVVALLAGLGMIGYFLGLLIVRPLDRLGAGAALVAAGDLGVDLPVVSGGEVGYLTELFNNMVARLREGRGELERLSLTDSLTGLANRRHLMETLANEVRRSARLKHTFTVLMADIDHFKRYNDSAGHLAGDEVLTRVAAIVRRATRDVDLAARYGGEEFLVLLPESRVDGGVEVAERIRAELADHVFTRGQVTISIGVAEFPAHGDTLETIIAAADAALYQAKHEGRNRVVSAEPRRRATETRRGVT